MKLARKIALAIIVISGLIAALAATVHVTLAQGGPGERFTICHAAGLAGTTHFVTLVLPREAVFANANGIGGHFFENGTTQAGHEQDYFGPCTTDTTGTTDTTPTTGTTTTTPTTTGDERGVATAGAICVASENRYRVFGEIDGVVATVSPQFIPGDRNGPTLVNVTVGSDSQLIIVNTAGTCISTTTTTTPTTTTQPPDSPPGTTTSTTTTPPATTTSETVTTPPTTTSGVLPATTTTETTPEAPTTTETTTTPRTPAVTPKAPVISKPKVPASGIPVPPQGCPEGSLPYQGKCYPAKFGGPVLPGQQG